jgi:hypothetical protein
VEKIDETVDLVSSFFCFYLRIIWGLPWYKQAAILCQRNRIDSLISDRHEDHSYAWFSTYLVGYSRYQLRGEWFRPLPGFLYWCLLRCLRTCFHSVMTYMPQDFRGTLIRQQRERSERNKQAEVDALVNSGGSIRDRYALLWRQQMDRWGTLVFVLQIVVLRCSALLSLKWFH